MTTLGELNVLIGADIDQFEAAMNRVQQGLGRLGDGAKQLGSNLTAYVTAPLGVMAGAAVAAFGKIDSLQRGINAITLQDLAKQGVTGLDAVQEAAVLTKERVSELNDIAKAPGIGFEQAIQGDIRLRAVGISARDSAKDLKEFANAVATSGGSADDFNRVTVQLAQLSAKGKVLAQDLRPIIEAAPAVAQALQKLYGTIDSEDISKQLEKQGKSSSDFINVLTDELAKLPRVTGGFANQLENFQQGVVQNAARLGDSLNKAFNLEGLLAKASDFVDGLTMAFTSLSPATQKLIFGVGAAAAAIGPLLFGFGAIVAAIPSVVAGLEVLGVASSAALGPIGIGVAAVAAAAYLIINNWGDLVAYFGASGEGGRVFGDLAESVQNSADVISEAFGAFSEKGDGSLGGLVTGTGILRAAFRDLTVGVTAFSDVVGGTIGAVVALFKGDLTRAAEQATRALYGLIDPIANVLGFTKAGASETIASFLKVAETERAIDEAALAGAASLNELTGSLAAASDEAGKAGGLLANLRERLKELKEQREAATTTKDALSFNPQIEAVEKQIKLLEGSSRKGKNILAELEKALRDNGRQSVALGYDFDYLGGRQNVLQAGVTNLIKAGYDPAGRAVQGYAKELQALNRLLADNAQLSARMVKGNEKLFETPDFKVNTPAPIQAPEVLLPDYESIFRNAAIGIERGAGGIQEAFGTFTQAQADFNTRTGELMDMFPAEAFAQIGASVGQALGEGTSVIEAFGSGLLKALGSFMAEYGKIVLLKGAADIAMGNYLQGSLELAAGAALVAGAGVASAIGSRIGGGSPSLGSTPSTPSPGRNVSGQAQTFEVVFKLRGQDLIGAARVGGYRELRSS